ncbi:hypothetical protein DRO31_02360 [Candidatus Bathyarchaeota archaeon]|nr:MAG: hypothetical protein DRO31_02360 [Candidatus Bathyarchaeota archaeon]
MSAWASLRTLPSVLGLMVRAPGWALDYSMSYKRAKKEFRKQLIDEGIPYDDAEELAELFPFKMSDIIETVRSVN